MRALCNGEYYTYTDYASWDDKVRYELIDGVPYAMAPAPSWQHQSISVELLRQIANFLIGKPCKVFAAPFDVRLNADSYDDLVVQPDIVVICDNSKISKTGCNGAPDMVIEILSPSTARHDKAIKLNKYLKCGVKEYWIVDPDSKTLSKFELENGKYVISAFTDMDTVDCFVLDGCVINLTDVFAGI